MTLPTLVKLPTHNERVLAYLADGKPHSHLELYDLRVIAHSRVAALRRKGHTIECWREGRLYFYRLVPPPAPVEFSSPYSAGAPLLELAS